MFYMPYYMMMKTIFYDFMYNNLIAESEDTRGKEESIFGKKGTIQYLHKFPLMGISFFYSVYIRTYSLSSTLFSL